MKDIVKQQSFDARVQAGGRLQIPRILRTYLRLRKGTLLQITLTLTTDSFSRESFLVRVTGDGRICIPVMARRKLGLKPGQTVKVKMKILTCRLYGFVQLPDTRRRKRMQVYTAPGLSSEG